MVQKSMTDVEKSIHEQSDKITEARKAIKERKQTIDNSDIVAESLSSENWKVKDFSFPDKTVRLGTVFSGIGAIEHAFQRLKLKHKIVFAGDIDSNCKKATLQITKKVRKTGSPMFGNLMQPNIREKLISLLEGLLVRNFQWLEKDWDLKMQEKHCFTNLRESLKKRNQKSFCLKM